MRMWTAISSLAVALLASPLARAQEHEHHEHHEHHAASPTPRAPSAEPPGNVVEREKGVRNVGLDEKLGKRVPLDLEFTDENGEKVTLGSLLTLPTIVIPIFYHCSGSCPIEMESVAKIVPLMGIEPGKDFRILSVSFDPDETPEDAASSKKNFIKILGDSFPPDAWRFLVGDRENVQKFLDAIGFQVHKVAPHNFLHPNAILAMASDGKISRYLYGSVYLPFDATLALSEASKGISGLTARRMLTYCYTYDSAGNRYVFDVTKASAATTLTVALGFGLFLAFGKKKRV